MILVLRDDRVIEIFDSIEDLPRRLEAIDVGNQEYQFCDDHGQRYIGVITKPIGRFRAGAFELRAEGSADLANAMALIDQATDLAENESFHDLASLRRHLIRG